MDSAKKTSPESVSNLEETNQVADFTVITESPYTRATRDQLEILYTRYMLARQYSEGKDVLEVGCGAGTGIGLIAEVASRVVGGDIDEQNLATARETYGGRPIIKLLHMDAHKLPFPDQSFEVVVFYEALYYLHSPEEFLREARRVLKPGGRLLISSVNCRWAGFNPSPLSTRYFNAAEIASLLERHGFVVEIKCGFPDRPNGRVQAVVRMVRRVAANLNLIPKTMKGKEWLKRLFYGKLQPIPRELSLGFAAAAPLTQLAPPYDPNQCRFIYAIGTVS